MLRVYNQICWTTSYPVCRLALSRMRVGAMVGAVVVSVLLRRAAGPCNTAIYQVKEKTILCRGLNPLLQLLKTTSTCLSSSHRNVIPLGSPPPKLCSKLKTCKMSCENEHAFFYAGFLFICKQSNIDFPKV